MAAKGAEYRVGIGDKLDVGVFGHADLNKTVEVRGDGTVDYALLGTIPVAGQTLSQIDKTITEMLAKDYVVDPQVSVEVKEYGSQWVTIMGEVKTPGRYLFRQDLHLIDLLAQAGGLTPFANRKEIEILRGESSQVRRKVLVNLKAVEEGRSADTALQPSDVVMVRRRIF